MQQEYFGKQWRPRWNAALCGISSGSTLFAKDKNDLQIKKYNLDYITFDPSLYTLDHSKFIISNQMEEFIRYTMGQALIKGYSG